VAPEGRRLEKRVPLVQALVGRRRFRQLTFAPSVRSHRRTEPEGFAPCMSFARLKQGVALTWRGAVARFTRPGHARSSTLPTVGVLFTVVPDAARRSGRWTFFLRASWCRHPGNPAPEAEFTARPPGRPSRQPAGVLDVAVRGPIMFQQRLVRPALNDSFRTGPCEPPASIPKPSCPPTN